MTDQVQIRDDHEDQDTPPVVPLWERAKMVPGLAHNGPMAIRRLEQRHGPYFVMGVGNAKFHYLCGTEVLDLLRRKDSGDLLHEPSAFRRAFSETLDGAAIVNSLEGDAHSRARSVINRGTHGMSGAHRVAAIADLTRERLEKWVEQGPSRTTAIRVFADLAARQSAEFLGLRMSDQHIADIRTLSRAMVRAAILPKGGSLVATPGVRAAKARLREVAQDFISEVDRGLVDEPVLLADTRRATERHPELFREDDLVWHILTPIIASAETLPGSTLELLWHVYAHPELVEEIRDERAGTTDLPSDPRAAFAHYTGPLVDGCVAEALRIAPVTWMLQREAARGFEFAGHRVPQGATITLNTTGAHFDEAYFPDPWRFDPHRDELRTHARLMSPFGTGTHICPGISLSSLLMKISLVEAAKGFELAFRDGPIGRTRGRMSFTGPHSFSKVSVVRR